MNKKALIPIVAVFILLVGGLVVVKSKNTAKGPAPTPTEEPLQQLSEDQYPKVSLQFRPDGHYVTVNITNLHAAALEYNLIYDAMVKKSRLQTGVNASAKLEGKTEYSKEQLLGSESSGKFTYHAEIENAVMELTLRDSAGRSIYTASYPFEVSPGKSIDLTASE